MTGLKRTLIATGAILFTALPSVAALHETPPPYGYVILSVESHFDLTDQDQSGQISAEEYIAVSAKLKNQQIEEARKDFIAMDMNDDGALSFDEFYGELPSDLTV